MILNSVSGTLASTSSKTFVLFAYQINKVPNLDTKGTDLHGVLEKYGLNDGTKFKGNLRESIVLRDELHQFVIVGLGEKKKIDMNSVRIASAVAVKVLTKEKVESAAFCVQNLRSVTKSPEEAGQALAEGVLLGGYNYKEFKTKKKDEPENQELKNLHFVLSDKNALKRFSAGVHEGEALAWATNFARDLGNAPSNHLTPVLFAQKVSKAAKEAHVTFKALDKKQIAALEMGCLLGVNKGSDEEPRFVVLEYHGAKKESQPLVFVGKGITFDTGGISIKPSAAMEEMKFDMCGGANVCAAVLAIAKLKLKINAVALVPLAENMPGGHAIKPGDILRAMSGKTIEVNNTDAEGRLILADALHYACEKYEPVAILDAATLTGACVVALGNVYSGFFTKDKSLVKRIEKAATESGEKLWQLPLSDEYVEDMKGTYADLNNIGAAKGGGASQAAAFLSQFVPSEIPWAHFDIAGSAWHTGNRVPYNPDKGASGSLVRFFTRFAADLQGAKNL